MDNRRSRGAKLIQAFIVLGLAVGMAICLINGIPIFFRELRANSDTIRIERLEKQVDALTR